MIKKLSEFHVLQLKKIRQISTNEEKISTHEKTIESGINKRLEFSQTLNQISIFKYQNFLEKQKLQRLRTYICIKETKGLDQNFVASNSIPKFNVEFFVQKIHALNVQQKYLYINSGQEPLHCWDAVEHGAISSLLPYLLQNSCICLQRIESSYSLLLSEI